MTITPDPIGDQNVPAVETSGLSQDVNQRAALEAELAELEVSHQSLWDLYREQEGRIDETALYAL